MSRLQTPRLPIGVPLVPALAAMVAVAAAAVASDGGHLSLDSVQQLIEAGTGRSTSWSPPFMSAVLSMLGGVPFQPRLAAFGFVVLVCALTWWGFLLAASHPVAPRFRALRGIAIAALLLNPVLLVYSGIVWKDLLLAGLCASALAMALASLATSSSGPRLAWGAGAMVLAAVMPEVRQHGIFVLPCVAMIVALGVAWLEGWSRLSRALLAAMLVGLALATHFVAGQWARATIVDEGESSTSMGFRSIASFDLMGIERRIDVGPLRKAGFSAEEDAVLAAVYTPDRVDFVRQTPVLGAYVDTRTTPSLLDDWKAAIVEHPAEYLDHRKAAYARLLGAGEGGACLPVHLGVSGIPAQLEALGYADEIDATDRTVYGLVQPLFGGPLFFHGTYLLALVAMAALLPFVARRSRLVLGLALLAPAAYYASFTVTGIACDFRYLYPPLVMVTLVAIAMLAGWREADDASRGGWR